MKFPILQFAILSTALATQPVLAQTMKPKPAGDAAPMMVVDTPTFVKVVTSANEFEIRSSELAKQNTQHAGIGKMADMIIADHRKAGEKLKAMLDVKDAKPAEPVKLARKEQKMLDQLQAAEGKDFDMLYLDMQAQAHMEAIGLFRTYAGSGDNVVVAGFARETLPSLETHLGHVKKLITEE